VCYKKNFRWLFFNKKRSNTLIKKKIEFSLCIRKFRMEQLQSHIWLTASSYMVKYLWFPHILESSSSYMQLLHSEFPDIWGKIWFSLFMSVKNVDAAAPVADWPCPRPPWWSSASSSSSSASSSEASSPPATTAAADRSTNLIIFLFNPYFSVNISRGHYSLCRLCCRGHFSLWRT
jgi:hypothetical protein